MSAAEKKAYQLSIIDWFKKIEGWQKTVFVSIVLSVITGITAFTYQHVSLPADNRRMNVLSDDVKQIKVYIANDAIEKAVEKADIQYTKERVDELKQEMRDNFKEIKDLLNMSYRLNKKIENNTDH
jgi:hypothetical protein